VTRPFIGHALVKLKSAALIKGSSASTPKSTDLSFYSQEELDAIADEINNRSRKGLGVRSALIVSRALILNSAQHSTLNH
jgi:hypothetical protein